MRNGAQGENQIVFKGIIYEVFKSMKRVSHKSPFPLVPRGPLGPHSNCRERMKSGQILSETSSKTFFVCLKAIDYHNVGHMLCMHARPHRRKDQLPLRSLRDLRSR